MSSGETNRQLVIANQEFARLYEQISALVTQVGNELTFPGEAPIVADASHPMSSEEMLGRMARLIVGHKRLEDELRQSQKMEAVGRLGRRHRARLQQYSHRDQRLLQPVAQQR